MFDLKNWIQLPETYAPVPAGRLEDNDTLLLSPVWKIESVSELWDALDQIRRTYKRVRWDYPETLWFRGQGSAEHLLLPYLIRSYFDKNLKYSLPQYQRMLLEKFLARSQEAPEIVNSAGARRRGNEQIEYIADMQHYSIPTSLLDWSEDVSVSLYFATSGEGANPSAALYILHPYFYNFVRHEIMAMLHALQESGNPDGARENMDAETESFSGGLIPNLAANFNVAAKRYDNYVVGPDRWDSLRKPDRWHKRDPLSEKADLDYHAPLLPLAIQVPRSNIRIRKQNGAFMAFNLCEFPQKPLMEKGEELKSFQHIELQSIQEFYLKSARLKERMERRDTPAHRAMKNRCPFLYKLVITSEAIAPLRDVAAALGKREDTVYPELYRIGKQITSEIV